MLRYHQIDVDGAVRRRGAECMGLVHNLRQQHGDLLDLARQASPLLAAEQLALNWTKTRLRLSAFARKLRVHLLLEERFIYERLLRHSDPDLVAKAARHQKAAHSLVGRVSEYARRLTLHREIASEELSTKFVEETIALFDVVSDRFRLEDDELYPVVDQILAPSGTWPLDLIAESDEQRGAG